MTSKGEEQQEPPRGRNSSIGEDTNLHDDRERPTQENRDGLIGSQRAA